MNPAAKIENENVRGALLRAARVLRVAGVAAIVVAALAASASSRCAFAAMWRIPCPACGSTRSLAALAHGDVVAALHLNPLAPFVAFVLGFVALRTAWLEVARGHSRDLVATPLAWLLVRALPALLVVELLVWAVRFAGFLGGPVPVFAS